MTQQLNAEQSLVVAHREGPLVVAATAGSGKTSAVTHRIVELVRCGVSPARILATTFSVKAAREMSTRLERMGCCGVRIQTFHSLANQIIRYEIPALERWKIDDTDRYRICVKDAVGYRYMNWTAADVTYIMSYIARCKASGATPHPEDKKSMELAVKLYKQRPGLSRSPHLVRQAYEMAELVRRERQLLTFDDMLLEAWQLFETDESARQRWASRFDYVIQDESQDENFVQHGIATQLARDHRNYMIVGDLAQSIYGFRGADPASMLRFQSEWDAAIVRMSGNYRCGARIVDVANRSLTAMPVDTHLGVLMTAERDVPGVVDAREYEDFDEEGREVAEQLKQSHVDGRKWSDHVLLYRTNAQSRGPEESLLTEGIPYVVLGGTNFLDRREVRDLIAYVRCATDVGEFEDVRRSINTPFRYLGKAFLDGLAVELGEDTADIVERTRAFALMAGLQSRQRTSALQWCDIVTNISQTIERGKAAATSTRDTAQEIAAKPGVIFERLVSDLKYAEWLTRDEGSESPENNRVSNVRELVRMAGRFPTVEDFFAYVDDIRRRAEEAKRRRHETDVVTLCSIHRAKGLEWPVVFVLGVNEKILPHAAAEDENEERRLFYVACTRARDELHLSYVAQAAVSNRVMQLAPSRYLVETQLVDSEVG